MLTMQLNYLSLDELIQLNPFDAVIVFDKKEDQYVVERMNTKATRLFSNEYIQGMAAKEFFPITSWQHFQRMLERPSNYVQYMRINTDQLFAIIVKNICIQGKTYSCLVMRADDNVTVEMFESHLEIAKHLYFVEQYLDPVFSLDLEGKIIYLNIAALKSLNTDKNQLIGKNIYSFIDEESTESFQTLIQNTLEGYPMSMTKIKLKNRLFSHEAVYMKTFPTYWDQKVIGVHIVVKNMEDFLRGADPYHQLTYRDELTNLLNRRALNEQWTFYTERFDDMNVALILVDIDRFKEFNKSLGKKKADGMLKEMGQRLQSLKSEFCEVFRYNGDEFVVLLNYYVHEEIDTVMTAIFELFKQSLEVDGHEYFLTASVGISVTNAEYALELDEMLHRADQALFFVKQHGRGHYRFYRKEMSQAFPNEALMEAHLRRAIEFDELSLHMQPQVHLQTNEIVSFEALLRWNNRKFGAVPPAQFIPLAEESGLIIEIGDWVLMKTCEYLAEWADKNYRDVRVAVNISSKQFKQDGFVSKIKALLNCYSIKPHLLELEITESSMTNLKETTHTLEQLKQLGVYVSVDDFGTGYSSFSYLKSYPIDTIKIDQSFIADLEKDTKNEAIVKAIIAMSHNLGLEVIAEGVEKKDQEQFLLSHNCNKVQGYLYNKPLPVAEIEQLYLMDS